MKNVNKLILICFIIIVGSLSCFLYFNYIEKNESVNNNPIIIDDQEANIVLDMNDTVKKYEVGKVDIINFNIENTNENESHLIITLQNNIPEDIDLTDNYKVYVYDKSNNYIVEYNGNALGIVSANSTLICNIKIDFDASIIGKVIIKKIND